MLRIRAQKQVMAEKEARKRQSGHVDLSDSSMSSSSASNLSDTMTSSRANTPQNVEDESSFTESSTMISAREEEIVVVERDGAGRDRGAMRAVMMSSHNVSSIVMHLNDEEDNEETRQLRTGTAGHQKRKVVRRRTSVPSVDLSHASRDPVVAAPRDILNKDVRTNF